MNLHVHIYLLLWYGRRPLSARIIKNIDDWNQVANSQTITTYYDFGPQNEIPAETNAHENEIQTKWILVGTKIPLELNPLRTKNKKDTFRDIHINSCLIQS